MEKIIYYHVYQLIQMIRRINEKISITDEERIS